MANEARIHEIQIGGRRLVVSFGYSYFGILLSFVIRISSLPNLIGGKRAEGAIDSGIQNPPPAISPGLRCRRWPRPGSLPGLLCTALPLPSSPAAYRQRNSRRHRCV